MATDEMYDAMIQRKGSAYRDSQIQSYSHYRDPIDHSADRLAGNSHVWGDASPEVQSRVIDTLVKASEKAGLNARQTAYVLAIARVESGFNPDAAAGTTSAHGLGQFIDRTGAHYGLLDSNRNNVGKQAEALVAHYLDNAKLAKARGLGEEYIYKHHHDGPSKDYGGLGISNKDVMPYLDQYEKFVRVHQQQYGQNPPQQIQEQTTPKHPTQPVFADGMLMHGEKGTEVREVQALLNKLGYREAGGHLLKEDGSFGLNTKEAVQAFQQAHELKVDGVVGSKTFDALKKAEQAPLLSNPNHPDHALYKQVLTGLEKLPSASFKNDQERQNAAASIVFEAKVSGLKQIDHVVLSTNGTGLFAVQGRMDDPAHHRIYLDKVQAASQPIEQSTQQVEQEAQRQQAQYQQQPQQVQTPRPMLL